MPNFPRAFAGLVLFSIAFGYLEASVVVYGRTIYTPLQHELMAGRPMNDLFPLIDSELLQTRAPEAFRMLLMEIAREAATLLMLAAVALMSTRTRSAAAAAYAVAFGVWDITFYLFLRLLTGWPASFTTWDLLFLLPLPWVGPVWSPVVVALSLIVGGTLALWRPLTLGPRDWAGFLAACTLIMTAFMWDFRGMLAGELPVHFQWPLFWSGELLGIATFVLAWRRSSVRPRAAA